MAYRAQGASFSGHGLTLGLLLFLYHFLMWYYTLYIVTDQRIRQVTQRGFFGKDVEIGLSKVQSISYNIPWVQWGNFKFGTIVMQTYVGDLIINKVEHPEQIYNKLQDAVAYVGKKVKEAMKKILKYRRKKISQEENPAAYH